MRGDRDRQFLELQAAKRQVGRLESVVKETEHSLQESTVLSRRLQVLSN